MITICRNDLYANVTVPIKGWALIEPAGYRWVTNNRVYIFMFSLSSLFVFLFFSFCLSFSTHSFVPTSDKEEETVLLLCQERRHICIAK